MYVTYLLHAKLKVKGGDMVYAVALNSNWWLTILYILLLQT